MSHMRRQSPSISKKDPDRCLSLFATRNGCVPPFVADPGGVAIFDPAERVLVAIGIVDSAEQIDA